VVPGRQRRGGGVPGGDLAGAQGGVPGGDLAGAQGGVPGGDLAGAPRGERGRAPCANRAAISTRWLAGRPQHSEAA
jgi:hypothetical protein